MAARLSSFSHIEKGLPIEVFELTRAFNEDPSSYKVNLGVGAYRDENGKPWVLPVVRKVGTKVSQDENLNHEYLPVCGPDSFTLAATRLLLGDGSSAINENRAFGVQTLSGTGALRLGAEFLAKLCNRTVFYYSEPTWENHRAVFLNAGFQTYKKYRYWNSNTRSVDFSGLIDDLCNAPEHAVIILHACAHNPTGCDLNKEQWKKLCDIMEQKRLFPFFDSAYQGFASGNPDDDAWAVRYFVSRKMEFLCAQSFAKNFGLYNERVGNLVVVQSSSETKEAVHSQLTLLVRAMYSNPPAYGSRIVSTILNDTKLRSEWLGCIKTMSSRIIKMRESLYNHLVQLNTPGKWNHITDQIGMFSYTGLNRDQCKVLIDKFHIYLLSSGRISLAGLNNKNVEYVAKAIHSVVTK